MEINFDELASLQQANTRASKYEFKRIGKDKFNLSNKGKTVIGYDETKGWEVKHGNGIVVIAVRLKDDPRVKVAKGLKGNPFTSDGLESIIIKHLGEDVGKCTFEKVEAEYDGATWYKIVPVTTSTDEVETNENNDSQEVEAESSDQESTNEESAEEQSDESAENVSTTDNDDF